MFISFLINQGDELQGFTIPSWDWIEISANQAAVFIAVVDAWNGSACVCPRVCPRRVIKANAAHSEGSQGVLMGGLYQDGLNDVDTGVILHHGWRQRFLDGRRSRVLVRQHRVQLVDGQSRSNIRMTVLEDRARI